MNKFSLLSFQIKQWTFLRRGVLVCALWIVGMGLGPVVPAAAQEVPVYDLPKLLVEVSQSNPQIQAAESLLAAAKKRVPQSSSLPDPMVGYSYMGEMVETRLGPQEDIYEFEQEIPFPGKLLARRKMAHADVDAAQANLAVTQNDTLFKTVQTYYELLMVKEALTVAEEIHALMVGLESVAQSRYAGGRGSQQEISSLQIELSKILKELVDLRSQQESLTAMLSALLNQQGSVKIEGDIEEPLPVLKNDIEELLAVASESRPELREAQAMTQRENHAYRLAKYENAPDFKIGFQYMKIGSGMTANPDDGRDAWMIPIKITLPIWRNRIDSTIAEAKNNLAASEANLQSQENTTVFEVKNAFYQWNAKRQIADLYRNALLPQTEIALHSAQTDYKAGEVPVMDFLESQRKYLEARIVYYRALADANISFAALQRVLGTNLSEVNNDE
jgi:outer membrane protein TolC